MRVTIGEAKRQFSHLLKRVACGEEVVITKGDAPIARLMAFRQPFVPRKTFQLGSAKGEFTVPDDFNDLLPKEIEDLFW